MKKENMLRVCSAVPILLASICMLFLPTEVPVHYSMDFQVTAYGSKYLLWIVGGIALLFGIFFDFIYKAYRKTENEALVYRLAILVFIIFHIINALSLIGALVFS